MTDFNAAPPAPVATNATGENPGKTMGIVGLILAFPLQLVGLIVSIIALRKSKKAGFKNAPALWGIIVSIVLMIIAIILIVLAVVAASALLAQCGDLGSGVHELENGIIVTCG